MEHALICNPTPCPGRAMCQWEWECGLGQQGEAVCGEHMAPNSKGQLVLGTEGSGCVLTMPRPLMPPPSPSYWRHSFESVYEQWALYRWRILFMMLAYISTLK